VCCLRALWLYSYEGGHSIVERRPERPLENLAKALGLGWHRCEPTVRRCEWRKEVPVKRE
jgi:hypothetical protein